MEPSTNIRKMMAGNKIIVPSYQRAYSWDTPVGKPDGKTQTDVFLSDLEEYRNSNAKRPYYFGHFLFEEREQKFEIIDGQQRLTTIVIFLSALFAQLRTMRSLSEQEEECYEDMIMRRSTIRFSTVDYDNQLFIDYVIKQIKSDHNGIETESAQRIIKAFEFFRKELSNKPEDYLIKMLSIIGEATCSTHLVEDDSEAIQMFIFQNNRGKKPSNLEIVKAEFMYGVHLYGNEYRDGLLDEIKNRFEKIYKAISSIEYRINEDDILLYTLRVHFNSLWETNALEKINKELSEKDRIKFIEDFTRLLSSSFEYLSVFFGKDERENFAVHSLITLGGIAIAIPFIIKAYKYALPMDNIEKLCSSLESLILRDDLIGTRAEIRSRINDVFVNFTDSNKDISPIIDRINLLKTTDDWWRAYWNDKKLEESLQDAIHHETAKYLLWKYENHLRSQGKSGYSLLRFNQIEAPELEHIAPTTEPEIKPHGYDSYDDDFRNQYLNCIGNYLLLSKSHNASIRNITFPKKHEDYKHLEQQIEIRNIVPDPSKGIWGKEQIKNRKEKIIRFIMGNL